MRQEGPDGKPTVRLVEGSQSPCPRCGAAAVQVADFIEVVVRNPAEAAAVKARGGCVM
jgi:hypothetical protein